MLASLILGVCAAVITLFAQIPFAETATINSIIFLTFLEETVRFCVLLAGTMRSVFPKNFFLAGIFFGAGFAGVETLLLEFPDPAHIALLFVVHIVATTFTLFLLSRNKFFLRPIAYLAALLFHIGYNVAVF